MLLGHEDKVQAFRNLIASGNLGHSYLFFGPPGIGKFLFAKTLAYVLEYGAFETESEPLIDAVFIAPDDKEIIGVEAVRGIKHFLSERPFRSVRRLVVLRDAEALTREAQSAMLKIVEEPNESALIVFIAREPQALFAPLRSRLTKIYFQPFSKGLLKSVLAKFYEVPTREAEIIAAKSFGRLGRALELAAGKKTKFANLEGELAEEINNLYFMGVRAHSELLKWLGERQIAIARFNLNARLQQKAVDYKMKQ